MLMLIKLRKELVAFLQQFVVCFVVIGFDVAFLPDPSLMLSD